MECVWHRDGCSITLCSKELQTDVPEGAVGVFKLVTRLYALAV